MRNLFREKPRSWKGQLAEMVLACVLLSGMYVLLYWAVYGTVKW